MTKEEFIKAVDGSPIDLEKVASIGRECSDWTIQQICRDYLDAVDELEGMLEELDVELG